MSRLLRRLPASLLDHSHASQHTLNALQNDFALYLEYFSAAEHDILVTESRRALAKMDWNDDHFDSVISQYREVTPKDLRPFPMLSEMFTRQIRPAFFAKAQWGLLEPHILELAPGGYIRPHIDNVLGAEGRAKIHALSIVGLRLSAFRCSRHAGCAFEGLTDTKTISMCSSRPDLSTGRG